MGNSPMNLRRGGIGKRPLRAADMTTAPFLLHWPRESTAPLTPTRVQHPAKSNFGPMLRAMHSHSPYSVSFSWPLSSRSVYRECAWHASLRRENRSIKTIDAFICYQCFVIWCHSLLL